MTTLAGLVTVALILLALASVIVADAWEARQFRGKFDCGCPWPSDDDDCPGRVTCPHGTWQFRVWRDWRGRQRDAWEADEGVDVMDDSFGARLRVARGGVSQVRLADLLGVTQTAVSYWESNLRRPGIDRIRRLADVMDVDPRWLAFGDEGKTDE